MNPAPVVSWDNTLRRKDLTPAVAGQHAWHPVVIPALESPKWISADRFVDYCHCNWVAVESTQGVCSSSFDDKSPPEQEWAIARWTRTWYDNQPVLGLKTRRCEEEKGEQRRGGRCKRSRSALNPIKSWTSTKGKHDPRMPASTWKDEELQLTIYSSIYTVQSYLKNAFSTIGGRLRWDSPDADIPSEIAAPKAEVTVRYAGD